MLYALGAVAGALLNRIRGGWWLELVKLPADSPFRGAGVWLPAFFIFYLFLDHAGIIGAVLVALAYVGGESFGWTKWLRGVTGLRDPQNSRSGVMTQEVWNTTQYRVDDTGQKNGIHFLAHMIFKENQNYWAYCMLAFAIRGVYWWAPVALVLWFFGVLVPLQAVLWTLFLAVTLPVSYWLMSKVELFGLRYLARSEFLYGAIYGTALVYASMA